MKLKSKLVLAASSLLVLSGVAAGTSTYAWFTANTNAYSHFSSATVQSHMEDLSVSVVDNVQNTYTTSDSAGASLTLTKRDYISDQPDVSYDPVNKVFVRPILTDNGNDFTGVTTVSNPVNVAGATETNFVQIYYNEVELEFSTTDKEITTGVFLDKATAFVNSKTSPTSDLAMSYRVAIFGVTTKDYYEKGGVYTADDKSSDSTYTKKTTEIADTSKLLALYAPSRTIGDVEGKEKAKYLPSDTSKSGTETLASHYTAYSDTGTGNLATYLGSDNFTANNTDSDFDYSTAPSGKFVKGYFGQAGSGDTGDEKLKVFVRFWAEGTDSLGTNASLLENASVNVSLKFIGVNTNGKSLA